MAIDSVDILNPFDNAETTASHIWNLWDTWNKARKPWKTMKNEIDQYIEATDTKGITTMKAEDYSHTVNRPKLAQIYDNLFANYKPGLMPTKNWFKWEGESEDAVLHSNRKLLEGFLRTKHRLSGFSKVIDRLLDDWIRTGNAFAGVEYQNGFATGKNEFGSNFSRGYKGPKVYRIDPFDIVFNATSTDWESAPKIVRSHYGIADLERKAATVGAPHVEKYRLILDKLKSDRAWAFQNQNATINLKGPGAEEAEKYYQLTFSGFGNYVQYLKSGMVEVLEFYGDMYNSATDTFEPDQHIVVVDRKYVILQEKTPTWNGKPHLYHCGWRLRANNIWKTAEKRLNDDYQPQGLLKFDQMVDADDVLIGNVDVSYTETGAKEYSVDENGDVKRLSPDTTILNADMQIANIEAAMDVYAGSPKEAMGFRTPGEKTKFEVSQLMNAAGRIFQHKLERFEEYMIEPLLNAEIEVTRQASDYNDTIELIDPENGAKAFLGITAKELYQQGAYIPIGARHYSRQQQLAQDARDLFEMITKDPGVLIHFPGKKIAKLFEELMGFEDHALYQEFGRIFEEMEKARITDVADKHLTEEQDAPVEEPPAGGANETIPNTAASVPPTV
ncbi:MAG: hypothetical protein ACWGQW_11445 [bacterium]